MGQAAEIAFAVYDKMIINPIIGVKCLTTSNICGNSQTCPGACGVEVNHLHKIALFLIFPFWVGVALLTDFLF
jgi:hypothetical protein